MVPNVADRRAPIASQVVREVPEEHLKKFPDLNMEDVDKQGSITLKITNLSAFRSETGKVYSSDFTFLDQTWKILFFPQGNNTDSFSLYLEHASKPPLPPGRGLCMKVILELHNEDELQTQTRETQHRFTRQDVDWGFTNYVKKTLFYSEEKGKRFIVEDTITVTVTLLQLNDPYGTLWNNFKDYDSKSVTNYVGLKNQGATCYMNSILQAWFFTGVFRRAVYQIPSTQQEDAKNVSLALQRVFYNLQFSPDSVSTTDLTVSFGWDSIESFMQHDVQEFNRVLLDKLESKMKGTPVEGTVSRIIEGKYKTFIQCLNVEFESSRVETFCDIQLNVKGLKNLEESFRDYIQVETLDGDNKYMAEGFGLQDARKGVIFESFPPVLHLQLKRFEYDFNRDANVKINDHHEFPLTIDLRPYLSNPETRQPQIFHLHGVLVHAGDTHGGHYCAFLRPAPHGGWFKYDDDRVTGCPSREALQENYGADPESYSTDGVAPKTTRYGRRHTNAYMLIYIRENELNDVLCPMEQDVIPAVLLDRFKAERQEEDARRKDREEQVHQTNVYVMTTDLMRQHHGPDLVPPETASPETPGYMYVLRVRKDAQLKELRALIAKKLDVVPAKLRLWLVTRRKNDSHRPDSCLTDENAVIADLIKTSLTIDLQIFAEVAPGAPDKHGVYFPAPGSSDILLFFKYFDPQTSTMTNVGSLVVKNSERPQDLVEKLCLLAGLPPKTPLRMWEEVFSTMVEEVAKPKSSFKSLDMSNGDTLCFMKEYPSDVLQSFAIPTPKHYFAEVLRRITVRFRPRSAPKDVAQEVVLQLKKDDTFADVAKALGAKIGHDAEKLRFTAYSHYSDGPSKTELRIETTKSVLDMLPRSSNIIDLVYYEKLDMTLAEMENKLLFSVSFLNEHMNSEGPYPLLIDRTETVSALIDAMKTRLAQVAQEKATADSATSNDAMDVEPPEAEYRLVEVAGRRNIRVLPNSEPVRALRLQYDEFYVQIVPQAERNISETDKKITVVHFTRDPFANFGSPFYFVIIQREKFADTRKRLQTLLNVNDKEWAKYKIAVISLVGKHEYLTEDDVVLSERDFSSAILGLDHVDRNARANRSLQERSLVIKN